MKYSGDSNGNDIVSEVLLICKATSTTYLINDLTRRINASLDDYFDLAFDADGPWSFDDINQSSAAIVTQSLVSGTNNYKVSAFAGSVVNILGLSILSSAGIIQQVTGEDFDASRFEIDYDATNPGQPNYYTKFSDFLYLRPTPNYSKALGLRAYVEREPLYMLPTDTSKEPGIPRKHHMYLCRKAALPYLLENAMPQASAIAALIQKDEGDIQAYYSYRDKSMDKRMVSFASQESNE